MPESPSADAFEELFIRHYPRVYGVLYRLVGRRDEAEDLALEAFLRLWRRQGSVETKMEAWLYRVASNLGYNALRARRRRENYELQAGIQTLEDGRDEDPPASYERREEIQRVRRTLQHMTPRQARLLVLRHSGLSYKELAGALGVAPGSIGTLLTRAEAEFETLFLTEGQP
jgi:RNA polymerase sigma-70 factor (ECF subfamily)